MKSKCCNFQVKFKWLVPYCLKCKKKCELKSEDREKDDNGTKNTSNRKNR